MKKVSPIIFAAIFMISCKKELQTHNSQLTYLANVKAALKDSLAESDFANIKFQQSIITKTGRGRTFLRIPFNGKNMSEEFLLLYTNEIGKIMRGQIIKLKERSDKNDKTYVYNGIIQISYLNRSPKLTSEIIDGHIVAFKRRIANRGMVVPSKGETESNVLPEVIVTCYISPGSDLSSYNSISLEGLFGGTSGGSSGYYSSMNETGGSEYQNNHHYYEVYEEEDYFEEDENRNGGNDDIIKDAPDLVDFEFVEDLSPIDITTYLKCFSNIPDYGATCSIEILVDIPVDEFPGRIFNFEQGSPGHTYLKITKTNGTQSVTQNIGFYPNSSWKMLFTNPVKNKIVDNSEHEFNASLKMNISPEQLNRALNHLTGLANHDYDIDDYNCTDFSLEVFNQCRNANPIEIEKAPIPGGRAENTSTPGALYKKLRSMHRSGIESANINFPQTKAYVGNSTGPCN